MGKMRVKRTLEEVSRSFKYGKSITAILFIQCILSFILIAYIVNSAQSASVEFEKFDSNFNKKISYTLTEKGNNEKEFSKYMRYDEEYFKLYKFVEELKHTEGLVFHSVDDQSIHIRAEHISNIFAYGYEEGFDKESSYRIDEEGNPTIWAKSMQVTNNVFDIFGVEVESGRKFMEKDFEFNPNDTVKVILGNNYKSYYKVGDVFDGNFLFTPIKCQVVGILSEKSLIPIRGNFIPTDRYIILPSFSKMNYYQNPEFAKIVLSQQAMGELTTTNPAINMKQLVAHLYQKYVTLEYDVGRLDLNGFKSLMNVSEETLKQLIAMLVVTVVFTIIGISVSFLGRIKRNYKTYGIHLLSGATLWDIALYTFNAIAVVIALAFSLSAILSIMFFGVGSYLLVMCGLAVVILILSCIQPIYKIIKMETSMLIRREE